MKSNNFIGLLLYFMLIIPIYGQKEPPESKQGFTVERGVAGIPIAFMANVDYKISLISGIYEVLVNREGGKLMKNNLELLGPIAYTDKEVAFGKKIQEITKKEHPSGRSTDVGDVSWNVPNINLSVTTAPKDTPWHSWAVIACGEMSIGHKRMLYAPQAMAMTMINLNENSEALEKVKTEYKERKGDEVYEAIVPKGPTPISGNTKK